MNIQPTNNLHFEGKLIAPTVVKQKVNKKWKDMPVNFVKFNTGDKFDRLSINFLSYLWNGGKNLSGAIAEEVSILKGKSNIYALTTQTDNFEKLDATKVLGIMSADKVNPKTKLAEIFKIGTNPKYAYEQNKEHRDIKHIASAMIDSFTQMISKKGKPFVSHVENGEEKFLEKVNLKPEV